MSCKRPGGGGLLCSDEWRMRGCIEGDCSSGGGDRSGEEGKGKFLRCGVSQKVFGVRFVEKKGLDSHWGGGFPSLSL